MPLAQIPPVGTVTMLFTDVEGSTRLAQELGPAWPDVLTEHRRMLREAIAGAGGYIEATEGDSFFATFASPGSALDAAINAQRSLRAHDWPPAVGELRVRMGLHTGDVEHTDGHYVGLEVHRGARVGSVACGGQVLMTEAVRGLFGPGVPAEDLGWHRLKDFPDPIRLYHLVVDEDRPADAFPPPRTLDVRPNNLPPADRPIVGRTKELKAIATAFIDEESRLVTLTGLGGVGKTTTGLAAARALLDTFTGGVWLVRAESLRSTAELLQAAAAAMRIRDVPGVDLLDAIAARLESGRYLLVLDNLEHLADAGALVKRLLDCAPGIAILATSRAPLRLASERTITLDAMAADEALSMFMSRAQQADPSLTLADRETRVAVEQLCERLGALPLALELAAARLRLMTPRQLLERLGSALDLRGADTDRPDRHRSIRATIEWTLDLLTPDASTLFTRLGIFLGAAPLDVIEHVCGDGIDVLEAAAVLVDYSLLHKSGPGLELVEALREVAAEQLAAAPERDDVQRAHAEAMVVLGRTVRSQTTASPSALATMSRLTQDTWAAARYARENDPRLHAALVANLSSWWAWTGSLRASIAEVDAALEADLRGPERGELLFSKAHLLLLSGRPDEAMTHATEAIELTPDRAESELGDGHGLLTLANLMLGNGDEAVANGRASLEYYRRAGDRERTVLALAQLAQAMLIAGDAASAGPVLDEAEVLGAGLTTSSALGLANIRADWCLANGDPVRALAGFVESLTHTIGDGSQLASWDIGGIVLTMEKLGRHELSLELGAMLAETAAEWGTRLESFSFMEGGVPAAMERARAALGPDRAVVAEALGRGISAKDRPSRALDVAREVLERLGVS